MIPGQMGAAAMFSGGRVVIPFIDDFEVWSGGFPTGWTNINGNNPSQYTNSPFSGVSCVRMTTGQTDRMGKTIDLTGYNRLKVRTASASGNAASFSTLIQIDGAGIGTPISDITTGVVSDFGYFWHELTYNISGNSGTHVLSIGQVYLPYVSSFSGLFDKLEMYA